MTITRYNVGPRLSDIAVYNNTAYFAGQVPESVPADIKTQTRQVLQQIDALLARIGSDKSRILQVQIFLRDIGLIHDMNEEWDKWVARENAPPRATVQASLADPNWLIEIVLSAAV